MQSVSDNNVRKRLLEKPLFELAGKGVFRLGRCTGPADLAPLLLQFHMVTVHSSL